MCIRDRLKMVERHTSGSHEVDKHRRDAKTYETLINKRFLNRECFVEGKERLDEFRSTILQFFSRFPADALRKVERTDIRAPFSAKWTHEDLLLSEGGSRISNNFGDSFYVGCIDVDLTIEENPSRWRFALDHDVQWMALGVCIGNIVKTAALKLESIGEGSGFYGISSNGFVMDHSKGNSQSGYSLGKGDEVAFEYDPVEGIITVQVNKRESFDLSIADKNAALYPCAVLYRRGDTVKVLQN
eukprot:TRINITY_DN18370_c0_g1_i1.p1 TRINITY_DN18370_c0_g1~~TRINITY_DN18370_c0_g1_i1.p1  ORF type:complete len:251 (+),score=40.04 TRINITY_DN18370_c0_g1_i1:27-755(+)